MRGLSLVYYPVINMPAVTARLHLIIGPFPSYFLVPLLFILPLPDVIPSKAYFHPVRAALSLLISSALPPPPHPTPTPQPPADGVDEFSLITAYCVCFMHKLVCLFLAVFPSFVAAAAASHSRYRAQLFHSSAERTIKIWILVSNAHCFFCLFHYLSALPKHSSSASSPAQTRPSDTGGAGGFL